MTSLEQSRETFESRVTLKRMRREEKGQAISYNESSETADDATSCYKPIAHSDVTNLPKISPQKYLSLKIGLHF